MALRAALQVARQVGEKMGQAWHRGIITLWSSKLQAEMVTEHTWEGGQYHILKIQNVLCTNYYVSPVESHLQEQMAALQESLEMIQWQGSWLWCGDFNEEWLGSWTATLAILNNGYIANYGALDSTRWEGRRNIDLIVSSQDLQVEARLERVSDHRILATKFTTWRTAGESQKRFQQIPVFNKPSWLVEKEWQLVFDEAVDMGVQQGWKEAVKWTEQQGEWPEEDEDGGGAVDLAWCLVCAQLTWAFARAQQLALLRMPNDFQDFQEMKQVASLANTKKIKGFWTKLTERRMPKQGDKLKISARHRWKKLGRLNELCKKMRVG